MSEGTGMIGVGVVTQPEYGVIKVSEVLAAKSSAHAVIAANREERANFLEFVKQVN